MLLAVSVPALPGWSGPASTDPAGTVVAAPAAACVPGGFAVGRPAAVTTASFSVGPVPVDTGLITAFAAAADSLGRIWIAVARVDDTIRLYRSEDCGRTWNALLWLAAGTPVRRLEVVTTGGDSGFVNVFFLESAGSGDLWLWRVAPDTSTWLSAAIAVGADTVDDFSACADRDSRCYLYCLYANEHRAGLTGTFARSPDRGLTWPDRTGWWNCWDPHVSHTVGSAIHCAWRYAYTGREVHYQRNLHYGTVGYWQGRNVLSAGTDKCWDPVVVEADTGVEWDAYLWAFYTTARRDTERLDVPFMIGFGGGAGFVPGNNFSQQYRDEWACDLAADLTGPGGVVGLCYNKGGRGPEDSTAVYWRIITSRDPWYWSQPQRVKSGRAATSAESARPRVIFCRNAPMRLPGIVFSL
jgi:hypothetical protein